MKHTKLIVMSAVFAAMVASLTFFPKIPAGMGYIHLGDSIVFLAACILPLPYALCAAAVGGALADLLSGYAQWIVPTLVIKALITLTFWGKSAGILTRRKVLALVPAGLITVVGYSAACWYMYGWAAAIAGVGENMIQVIGSSAAFIAIAAGLDKVKFKQRILKG